MDEVWFYFILPMLAAAVVAVVEWRRYREGSEHGERLAALEGAHNNLVSVVNDMDAPDLRHIENRLHELDKAVSILNHRVKAFEE